MSAEKHGCKSEQSTEGQTLHQDLFSHSSEGLSDHSIRTCGHPKVRGVFGHNEGGVNIYECCHSKVSSAQKENMDCLWKSLLARLHREQKELKIPSLPWLKWELDFKDYFVDLKIKPKHNTLPNGISFAIADKYKFCKPYYRLDYTHSHNLDNDISSEPEDSSEDYLTDACENGSACHLENTSNNAHENRFKENINGLPLTDIFMEIDGFAPTRILIEASAGYGKTTLATKLCFDHANGEEYIRHFDAVILLPLANFNTTLDELIINTLKLDFNAEDILASIKEKQSKVLFILDGFDELPYDKQCAIIPILKGERFTLSTVITTSRLGYISLMNETETQFTNLFDYMDSRVIINGLTATNRRKYLRSYLSNYEPDKLTSTIEQIVKKCTLLNENDEKNFFRCPLNLLLLVILAEKEDISSLETKTQLMKAWFNFMLRRMLAKGGVNDPNCDFFDYNKGNPPDYVQMLNRFGYTAMKSLGKNVYNFSEEEICACRGPDNILSKLGILTMNDKKLGLKRSVWFEPVHVSFVEFSIAYHLWINLEHPSKLTIFFKDKDVLRYLLPGVRSVIPFLFGLCGINLAPLISGLANGPNSEFWLRELTKVSVIKDLLKESELEHFEIARAYLPLVPRVLFIIRGYDIESSLFRETLLNAQQEKRLQSVILEERYSVNYSTNCLCKMDVYTSDIVCFLQELSTKVISHQNLCIGLEDECKLAITLCEVPLHEQLAKLSNWIIVDGLPIDKPIHCITYHCPLYRHNETLTKITELIDRDLVESVAFVYNVDVPYEPLWDHFLISAKKSIRLLEMSIMMHGCEEPFFINLLDNEGKRWRKLVLEGNVLPCFGLLSMPLEDRHRWNVQSSTEYLPSFLADYLLVNYMYDNICVFVRHESSPIMAHNLYYFLFLVDHCHCFKRIWNQAYLRNLHVLAVEFDCDFKERQQIYICTRLTFMLFHCHPQVRLELLGNYSQELISNFLLELRNSNVAQKWQLEALVLFSNTANRCNLSEETVKLLKEALGSDYLKYLWITGDELDDGLATPEFVNLFPQHEGFTCELGDRWGEKPPWWWEDQYYIQISMPKDV